MNLIHIQSPSNDKIKSIARLKEKRARDKSGLLFIEGYREISRAVASKRLEFDTCVVCPELFLGENEWNLVETLGCKVIQVPSKVFEKISYRDRPDGLVATSKIPDFEFSYGDEFLLPDWTLIIEGVEKPGNLGTILRTAEGAGFHTVFVADPRLDLTNPNLIRSSTGTIFTLSVYQVEIQKILEYLRRRKRRIYALSPEADEVYYKEDLKGQGTLLFGSEQYGLSELAKELSDKFLSIPMKGEADSLNLAMSAGILMYEVIRQNSQ